MLKPDRNSTWFLRPDYKKLGVLKQQFPDVPILALTATATQRVCDDLKTMLRIEACEDFSASVNRPNLVYEVPKCAFFCLQCRQHPLLWSMHHEYVIISNIHVS